MAGDVPAYLEELVEAVGKANHDYFVKRGQNRVEWAELPPIYRSTAREAHLEILQNGPVALIEREIAAADAWAAVLRLRLDMFIAELRERRDIANTDGIADELEATINAPLEG